MPKVIHLHRLTPNKPVIGEPCNGCGACCAVEPCPMGILISRKRHGRCDALLWDDAQTRYVCGMATQPKAYLAVNWTWLNRRLSRWAKRWIAAGVGCDSHCSTDIT
ncbi:MULTISPECIES: hypothetical protein [Deefgea]|uniref:4Fe-4S ferredoxin-type domain-containing protein n=1 Tax=Deefgea chitinilytica TaxID=570276 RepID=A0ABS2CEN0_9NEIS|nr:MULTISPECIES: hypothetical protein [Deefgea]MBM5571913.1 hypothetical protein [Deefgea chitinilytica]MBM9889148.1 hypothetical protein [Deefgea sp. CFH1-16]